MKRVKALGLYALSAFTPFPAFTPQGHAARVVRQGFDTARLALRTDYADGI